MKILAIIRRSYKTIFASVFVLFLCLQAIAQQANDNTVHSVVRNKTDNTLVSATFSPDARLKIENAREILTRYLGIDNDKTTMVLGYSTDGKDGIITERYYQYFKGIKVEFGSYSLMAKDGIVTFITGNYYNIDKNTSATPAISETEALKNALHSVSAEKYMWENAAAEKRLRLLSRKSDTSYFPHGALVWVEDMNNGNGDRKLHLAYSFDVYAQTPLSRKKIFVDAVTGKILFSNSIIKHTAATGHTKYSGVVPFRTAHVGPDYILFDSTRGNGIYTLNLNGITDLSTATDFASATNAWPTSVDDTQALDAHWGAEVVYDYWRTVQSRLSWDNLNGILVQFVHDSIGFNNAFWDGAEMVYGDGTGCATGFSSVVSLDVIAHEIGHGVCQATADLVYAKEPGALNEGFSDCWGASIENWGNPHETDDVAKATWSMGEEIGCGDPLRRLDSPKIKHLPDTYLGTYWYDVTSCTPDDANDQCGVHKNSGVICKWYYLVTMGGSGVNDNGDAYSVTGLTFTKSQNILYRTELVLGSNATYPDVRTASINVTKTLYGACSQEVQSVTNAWYAVGVDSPYKNPVGPITGTPVVCPGFTVTLSDTSLGGAWSSSNTSIATVVSGTGVVTGVAGGVDTIIYTTTGFCRSTILATVNAAPAAAITPAGSTSLCTSGSVVLNAGLAAGYTYQWKVGGSPIAGATTSSYTASSAGNYTLFVTNTANGCTATSPVVTVTVGSGPGAAITPSGPTTFCAPGSITLSTPSTTGVTYQWQLGGVDITGATNFSYTTSASGSYVVVVTNTVGGCISTSPALTVTAATGPGAAVTYSGATTFCAPATLMLNATAGSGLTYQWQRDGINIPGAVAATYNAATTGNYTVIVTSGPCVATSSGVAVIVNSVFAAPVGGPSVVCVGGAVTLTDTSSGGTWSSGASAIASVSSSGVVDGLTAGTANITYTVTNACGTSSASKTVTVSGTPPSIAPITGTLSICTGSTTTLADATSSGTWSSSNTVIATISASGVVSSLIPGTTLISYNVTGASGCVSSATATFTVYSAVTPVISPTGPTTFCSGGYVLFSATTGTGYTYQWKRGSTLLPGATNATYTASLGGNYTVTISESSGCHSTSSPVAVTVTAGTIVVPSVSIAATPGPVLCLVTAPVSFVASSVHGGTPPVYQWFVNGSPVTMGSSYGYTPANGDIVTVSLTSNETCAFPSTIYKSDTIVISPLQTPSVTVTASPGGTICPGNSVLFTALPDYGGTAPAYRWLRNTDTLGSAPTLSLSSLANGDVIRCIMKSNYACLASTAPVISAGYTMSVSHPSTNAVYIHVVPDSVIAPGQTVTFVATPSSGGATPGFQWYISGSAIPGATNATFSTNAITNGNVVVCKETSSDPCATPHLATSRGILMVVGFTGVKQIANTGDNFSLIPNPNNGEFTIKGMLTNSSDEQVVIVINDMLGKEVYRKNIAVEKGVLNENISLNRSTIASGTYILNLTSGSTHAVYHVVIEK